MSKHRLFTWFTPDILSSHLNILFARDDDYFFGVLHSYLHETWALRLGTWLGVGNDPRYTPTTTFETFPFPWSPGKEDTTASAHAAISAAAQHLHAEREVWLNPPDLLALGATADTPALRERTLTNLYNALAAHRALSPSLRSGEGLGEGMKNGEGVKNGDGNGSRIPKSARDFALRLAQLHDVLDRAVLTAYGWDDLFDQLRTPAGDEELLRRLLALNLERAGITT